MDLKKKNTNETPANNAVQAPAEKKAKAPKKEKEVFLAQKDMNFLERYQIVVEGKEKATDPVKLFMPVLIALGIIVVIFLIVKGVDIGINISNKNLNSYITDTSNVTNYKQAVALSKEIKSVNTKEGELVSMMSAVKTYPSINTEFFSTMAATATANGITVGSMSYDNTTGLISYTATTTSVTAIPSYVAALRDTGLFSAVEYTGYTGSTEGGYSFNIAAYCVGN